MIRIVVIDDHILLRDMIVDTLNSESDFNVVGVSDDAKNSIVIVSDIRKMNTVSLDEKAHPFCEKVLG